MVFSKDNHTYPKIIEEYPYHARISPKKDTLKKLDTQLLKCETWIEERVFPGLTLLRVL
jgi:hypothetical protein